MKGHALAAFASGEPGLDDWLKGHALNADAMNTARTFVWHRGNMEVVAYYSLAAYAIAPNEVPRNIGRGARQQIPAILLARLALDRTIQGQRLGGELLADALRRALDAGLVAAGRMVVVDALNANAENFYKHYGFLESPVPRRLVMKMSDIADALP